MTPWRSHRDDVSAFLEATNSLRSMRLDDRRRGRAPACESESVVDSVISKFRVENSHIHPATRNLVDSTPQADTSAGLRWAPEGGFKAPANFDELPAEQYMTLTCKIGPIMSPRLLVVPCGKVTSVQVTSQHERDEVTRITSARDDFYTTQTFDEMDGYLAANDLTSKQFAKQTSLALKFQEGQSPTERAIREKMQWTPTITSDNAGGLLPAVYDKMNTPEKRQISVYRDIPNGGGTTSKWMSTVYLGDGTTDTEPLDLGLLSGTSGQRLTLQQGKGEDKVTKTFPPGVYNKSNSTFSKETWKENNETVKRLIATLKGPTNNDTTGATSDTTTDTFHLARFLYVAAYVAADGWTSFANKKTEGDKLPRDFQVHIHDHRAEIPYLQPRYGNGWTVFHGDEFSWPEKHRITEKGKATARAQKDANAKEYKEQYADQESAAAFVKDAIELQQKNSEEEENDGQEKKSEEEKNDGQESAPYRRRQQEIDSEYEDEEEGEEEEGGEHGGHNRMEIDRMDDAEQGAEQGAEKGAKKQPAVKKQQFVEENLRKLIVYLFYPDKSKERLPVHSSVYEMLKMDWNNMDSTSFESVWKEFKSQNDMNLTANNSAVERTRERDADAEANKGIKKPKGDRVQQTPVSGVGDIAQFDVEIELQKERLKKAQATLQNSEDALTVAERERDASRVSLAEAVSEKLNASKSFEDASEKHKQATQEKAKKARISQGLSRELQYVQKLLASQNGGKDKFANVNITKKSANEKRRLDQRIQDALEGKIEWLRVEIKDFNLVVKTNKEHIQEMQDEIQKTQKLLEKASTNEGLAKTTYETKLAEYENANAVKQEAMGQIVNVESRLEKVVDQRKDALRRKAMENKRKVIPREDESSEDENLLLGSRRRRTRMVDDENASEDEDEAQVDPEDENLLLGSRRRRTRMVDDENASEDEDEDEAQVDPEAVEGVDVLVAEAVAETVSRDPTQELRDLQNESVAALRSDVTSDTWESFEKEHEDRLQYIGRDLAERIFNTINKITQDDPLEGEFNDPTSKYRKWYDNAFSTGTTDEANRIRLSNARTNDMPDIRNEFDNWYEDIVTKKNAELTRLRDEHQDEDISFMDFESNRDLAYIVWMRKQGFSIKGELDAINYEEAEVEEERKRLEEKPYEFATYQRASFPPSDSD